MLYNIILGLIAILALNACESKGSSTPDNNTSTITIATPEKNASTPTIETPKNNVSTPTIETLENNVSTPTIETPKNNAPTANIAKLSSKIEGSIVELNALNFYDQDGDNITFLWKQLSGKEVLIVNPRSASPAFIAPDVDTNSNVEVELLLSDGKDSSRAQIAINIINIIKEEKRQEVTAHDTYIKSSNGMVNVSYSYNKTPNDKVTSGLILNIYWNSKVLVFSKVTEKLGLDFMGVSSIKEDLYDKDSNKNTDKYLSISWVNLEEGNWKTPTVTTALFDLEMKEINSPIGTTAININTHVDSPGLHFYGSSVLVSLGE